VGHLSYARKCQHQRLCKFQLLVTFILIYWIDFWVGYPVIVFLFEFKEFSLRHQVFVNCFLYFGGCLFVVDSIFNSA
jgi:hypothetical protein